MPYNASKAALDESAIRALLPQELSGCSITLLGRTDSTNTRLRESLSAAAPHFSLLCADEQTAGRGRRGKSFFSPSGGIYMSVFLRTFPEKLPLTIFAAVAAADALGPFTGGEARIKWVNDILVGERKICGILAERVPEGAIVGFGVNLSTEGFPDELADIVGGLGGSADRLAVIAAITARLYETLKKPAETVIARYRERSMLTGRQVAFQHEGKAVTGTVAGIADDGQLLVDLGGEVTALSSGEVSVNWRGFE